MGDISHLPEGIIHHILSNLTTKEAARSSIFCKTWYSAWLTCPTLNFGKNKDNDPIYNSERREKLLKFIKNTLKRYQYQKICIMQLVLPHIIIDSYSHDKWIEIVVQNGVERLKLNSYVRYDWLNPSHKYNLSRTVFEAKTLRELIVRDTNMIWKDGMVMFNHLRKLHLINSYIDDNMFQGILTRCPLINNLDVSSCIGLERIKVTNLDNLKEFTVCALGNQHIEIDASHLQHLDCNLNCGGTLDLNTTEKLKYFSLAGKLPSSIFLDNNYFMHKFPQVEDLRLPCFHGVQRINISSHSLKRIRLGIHKCSLYKPCTQVREVKSDAPSMISLELELEGETIFFPDLSLPNASSQLVSKISMSNFYHMYTCELKKFLAMLIQSKISLALWFMPECIFFDYVREIPICPVVDIEDLYLCFGFKTSSTHCNFLKSLFMTYHPKAITMHRSDQKATEFLYRKLIASANQDLKEVRFEIYDEIKHEWQPSDWKNMQKALRSCDRVRFRLEWVQFPRSNLGRKDLRS